jgi:hypothetical protein
MDWNELRLEAPVLPEDRHCPCGIPLPAGTAAFRFCGVPDALGGLVGDRCFCTLACVRSFLAEARQVLEGAATPDLVADAHSVYVYLSALHRLASRRTQRIAVALASFPTFDHSRREIPAGRATWGRSTRGLFSDRLKLRSRPRPRRG